jgi:hypothetical protein
MVFDSSNIKVFNLERMHLAIICLETLLETLNHLGFMAMKVSKFQYVPSIREAPYYKKVAECFTPTVAHDTTLSLSPLLWT